MKSILEKLKKVSHTGKIVAPNWFAEFAAKISRGNIESSLRSFDSISLKEINEKTGGDISELPYELLRILLPNGSEMEDVAKLLREKRGIYLKNHPEEEEGQGAAKGVVSYDGRFMSYKDWKKLTPEDRFSFLVGPTCIHYNSDVPGYGDYGGMSDKAKF